MFVFFFQQNSFCHSIEFPFESTARWTYLFQAKMHPKTIPKLVSVCSSLRDVSTSDVVEGRNIKPTSLKKQIAIRCNKVLLSGVQNGSSEFTPEQSYT